MVNFTSNTYQMKREILSFSNTICGNSSISIAPGSSWSFHGKEVPYTAYGLEKFPLGHVVRKSVQARELTMYDLYLPLVQHPNPAAVIQAEKITGSVLLISSKMDTMWPSEFAAKQVMNRLQDYSFLFGKNL